jgi:tetratricopeptide (TPR) repeat protein
MSFLCPSISSGDSGELAASAHILGIPHPPGYPFYMILGRSFSMIFPGNPALGMNILSSIFAILSLLLIFQILLDFGIKPQIAFIPSILLSIHPLFLQFATITEVYTITSFFFLLELLLLKRDNYLLLSYVVGISFLIHPMLWIIGVYSLYKILKRDYRLIIYSFVGISVILYLPIRSISNPLIDWGNPETLRGVISHILRFEYYREVKVPFTFLIIYKEFLIWLKITLRDTNFLLLLLPFAIKSVKKEYLLLLLAYSLPLALFLHFKPNELNLEANRVFFLPQLILILILSTFALKRIKMKFLPIVGTFILTVFFILGYQERLFQRSWTSFDYIKTILEQTEIDKRSWRPVILSKGDALTFPLLYIEVLTERIKVKVNTPGLRIHTEDTPDYSTYWNEDFSVYDRMLFSKEAHELKPWNFRIRQGRKDILEDELYIKALTRYAVYLYKRGETTLSLSILKEAINVSWLNSHKITVASAYDEIKYYEQSVNIKKEILKKEPDYPGIYHSLYYSHLQMGKIDEAENFLAEGLLIQDDKNLLNDAGAYFAEKGFTNTAFLFFLDGLFKGAPSSGANIRKLIKNEILIENVRD